MDVAGRMDLGKTQSKTDRRANASGDPKPPDGLVRVAIADDDPLILEQIGNLLETRFEVVGRLQNGRELVEAVGRYAPAVVVTDIAMPVMNGIEAARLIKEKHPEVKVVILSVYSDAAFVESAFDAGASGYVVKVYASTDLIPAITEVLAGRQFRPDGSS